MDDHQREHCEEHHGDNIILNCPSIWYSEGGDLSIRPINKTSDDQTQEGQATRKEHGDCRSPPDEPPGPICCVCASPA